MLKVPPADRFPLFPQGWYLFGPGAVLRSRPVSKDLLGQRLVAYRTASGQAVVLEGRCAHLGADLGQGHVNGDCLRCPFHQWEYGPDGHCTHVPARNSPPSFARLASYPVEERHGLIFFFNGPHTLFPLPFFEGEEPNDFVAAKPFGAVLNCPWYMIGANAFDVQHFRGAHDRSLVGEPVVSTPHPFARRIAGTFTVGGTSLRNRLTRLFGGPQVRMTFTDWGGTIVLAKATFPNTASRGLVLTRPLSSHTTLVQVVVFVPRRAPHLFGRLVERLDLWMRRTFIRRFLRSDAVLGGRGLTYNPQGLSESDRELAGYFSWLAGVARNANKPVYVSRHATAPSAEELPEYPQSWFLWGASRALKDRPVSKDLLGRRLVAYRTASGRPILLDGRCVHVGADLGQGKLEGDNIRCPYHGWQYGPDGRCTHAPGCDSPPSFARLTSYPVEERHGLLFFFNGSMPLFPLPFFDGEAPDDFLTARPFSAELDCPWYMVGANAVDGQHFRGAHDRQMIGEPLIHSPHPHARRATAPFRIVGNSWRDRLTAWYGGDIVRLTITDYAGTIMFVTASFRRTRSHGMLTALPLPGGRVLVRGVAFVRRHRTFLGRLLDPLHAEVRRYFIGKFLQADALLARRGFRYRPESLIEADAELAAYWRWLAQAPGSGPAAAGSGPAAAGSEDSTRGFIRATPDGVPDARGCASSLEPLVGGPSKAPGGAESSERNPGWRMSIAPDPARFPAQPVSWYLFGPSRLLRRGPVSKDLLGRRLVAYRTATGRAVVLDARCSHLGADLGHGEVVGETIRCPFHHWHYGSDGACCYIPSGDVPPPSARQMCYPVLERHGYLFFFNGPEPLFPLPFFDDVDAEDCVAAKPLAFLAECPWYLPTANSFDVQHFRSAHDRPLLTSPQVDSPHPFARRIRFRAAVAGSSLRDRLLRRFAGDEVEVSITNWGGAVVVVKGTFAHTTSRLITLIRPLDAERCLLEVLVFSRKGPRLVRPLVEPVQLWLRRRFTHGFMAEEFVRLAGIRYNPGTLVPGADRDMIDYFWWITRAARGLPASHEQNDRYVSSPNGAQKESCTS